MVLETAALCLSLAIYFETRSDTIKSRTAIAEVVMVRAKNHQNNICKKVYQKSAFGSWTKRNKYSINDSLREVKSHKGPGNKKAWEESQILANNVIRGTYKKVLPKRASHFYNPKIDPRPKWATPERYVATIESHKYYLIEN